MPTNQGKITIKSLDGLTPGKILWDGQLKGFGARRTGSNISFVLMYRTKENRQRFYTIGKFGSPWSPERARDEALRLLYEVRAGKDPAGDKIAARRGETVAELCKAYLEEIESGRLRIRGGREKKPETIRADRSRISVHVEPRLGAKKVASITTQDIENFMHEVAKQSGKPMASRTVAMLGAIFNWAVKNKMRPDNPCKGIELYPDEPRNRRLTEDEYALLGDAIRKSDAWPAIPLAAKFLALTGWRSGEAMNLRRADVDFARRTANLPDTKTGQSMRPLAHRAVEILRAVPVTASELFFPSINGTVIDSYARAFAPLSPAPDITPHVLRHSFASLANDIGLTDATIGAMLGHAKQTMTSRYQHSADAVLLKAADMVADETARQLGEVQAAAQVIPLKA